MIFFFSPNTAPTSALLFQKPPPPPPLLPVGVALGVLVKVKVTTPPSGRVDAVVLSVGVGVEVVDGVVEVGVLLVVELLDEDGVVLELVGVVELLEEGVVDDEVGVVDEDLERSRTHLAKRQALSTRK